MKRTVRIVVLLVGALTAGGGTLAQPADWPDPASLSFEPVEFEAPEPRREVLSNGLVVYLSEDRSLPLVEGVAYVDAPGLYDPEGRTGLAAFTAAMLREGGAGGRSAEEISERLEGLAAFVEASADDTLASVSFSALGDTLDEVLPVWRDVLVAPDFAPARIEIQRQRQLEAIRRVADDPVQVALRAFYERVAPDHPLGDFPTEETIGAIDREDLVAFHDAYYGPGATVLAVSGDFDADVMLDRLEEVLGGWDATVRPAPDLPPFDPDPEPRVYVADKEVQQSVIVVGQPAMRAYAPPYDAFTVVNHVLGAGGFSSRLFTEIRTRRGLAYATGSQLSQGFEVPGVFLAFALTRADATGEVLGLLLDEIERVAEEGIDPVELERAVATLVSQSLFRDTSIAALTQRTARVDLLGLEPGYFEAHVRAMQDLTVDEAAAAAREVLDPEGLVIMVVGNAEAFERPLSDFGEMVPVTLE